MACHVATRTGWTKYPSTAATAAVAMVSGRNGRFGKHKVGRAIELAGVGRADLEQGFEGDRASTCGRSKAEPACQ